MKTPKKSLSWGLQANEERGRPLKDEPAVHSDERFTHSILRFVVLSLYKPFITSLANGFGFGSNMQFLVHTFDMRFHRFS